MLESGKRKEESPFSLCFFRCSAFPESALRISRKGSSVLLLCLSQMDSVKQILFSGCHIGKGCFKAMPQQISANQAHGLTVNRFWN
jgi:hypothetical protein